MTEDLADLSFILHDLECVHEFLASVPQQGPVIAWLAHTVPIVDLYVRLLLIVHHTATRIQIATADTSTSFASVQTP